MGRYIVLSSCFFMLLFLNLPRLVCSQTAASPEELNEIHNSLEQEKGKLKSFQRRQSNVLDELEQINRELDSRTKEIQAYTKQLYTIEASKVKLEHEISELNEKLNSRQKVYKERLEQLYKQYKGRSLSILINSDDYTELIKRVRYLDYLVRFDSSVMETYSKKKKTLIAKKETLKEQYRLLDIVKKQLVTKQTILYKEQERKFSLLDQIQREKSLQEGLVTDMEMSAQQLIHELQEKQRKTVVKPKKVEKAKTEPKKIVRKVPYFETLRGNLPWPVEGELISALGTQADAIYNVPMLKNGVLIEAEFGQVVRTVGKGVVVYADWFKGYGKLFIVNHGGGYHSLYGQLNDIFLKPGEKVDAHQEIGRVGEAEILNKTGLYFEIRYKGKPQDPVTWLTQK
ncbi:MAG TPA: peptidoglycan DD-metalloendopeptidase family protein [Thermodesulfovibrionia bacterium]|nr:peptidoglycan DD-metalloendopeptidase family protein [Thermodesulfovibrionia bacterium]